jgi:hypothetical protein
MLVCLCACVLVCLCACVLVCLCACVLVCLCACMLVCLYACIRVYLYACIYVYLYTCMLNNLYSSPNIVRVIKSIRMGWAGHVARMVRRGGCRGCWWGKPEGRRPLGRPRRRWVDNIRTDLQEVGCGYMDWIRLAQDRDRWRTLVSAVMNLRVP